MLLVVFSGQGYEMTQVTPLKRKRDVKVVDRRNRAHLVCLTLSVRPELCICMKGLKQITFRHETVCL